MVHSTPASFVQRRRITSAGRVFFLVTLLSSFSAAMGADRYDLAARITYSIAKFSDWPPEVGKDGTFEVGVFGSNSARAFSVMDGEKLKNGRIRVVNLTPSSSSGELRRCGIIFTSEVADLRRVAKATSAAPVLLVHLGLNRKPVGNDVCVCLFEANSKMQFDVYLGSMRSRNLEMDSSVLKLADTVHRR